jgi:nicotinamidase/pyrazinamidase
MSKKQIIIDKTCVLIVVDMQNDFLPGGALPVQEGDTIIDGINQISKIFNKKGIVVYTQDWHPKKHGSFASSYPNKKPGDSIDDGEGVGPILWVDHCVQNTKGATFDKRMKQEYAICIIRKGYNQKIDSYSAFYENDKKSVTGLTGFLNNLNIKKVFICGLALDYCCFFSAMDAKKDKFDVYFIEDLTKGIDLPEGNIQKVLEKMVQAKIAVIKSEDIEI